VTDPVTDELVVSMNEAVEIMTGRQRLLELSTRMLRSMCARSELQLA